MISAIDPSQMGGAETITWTKSKLRKFKRAYAQAVLASVRPGGLDVFVFDGHDFLIGYSTYLIEFLDKKLK